MAFPATSLNNLCTRLSVKVEDYHIDLRMRGDGFPLSTRLRRLCSVVLGFLYSVNNSELLICRHINCWLCWKARWLKIWVVSIRGLAVRSTWRRKERYRVKGRSQPMRYSWTSVSFVVISVLSNPYKIYDRILCRPLMSKSKSVTGPFLFQMWYPNLGDQMYPLSVNRLFVSRCSRKLYHFVTDMSEIDSISIGTIYSYIQLGLYN